MDLLPGLLACFGEIRRDFVSETEVRRARVAKGVKVEGYVTPLPYHRANRQAPLSVPEWRLSLRDVGC